MMADKYIKLEDAQRIVDDIDTWVAGWRDYAKRLIDSRSAADVVEVVRCKDCTHFQRLKRAVHGMEYCCEVTEMLIDPESDYCSLAERREIQDG